MRFCADDPLVQETTRNVLESTRGQWVYDHPQYGILNLALGRAYPAGWNKVTSPYRGLPQSSVDKVAGGGMRAEADSVRGEQKVCGADSARTPITAPQPKDSQVFLITSS